MTKLVLTVGGRQTRGPHGLGDGGRPVELQQREVVGQKERMEMRVEQHASHFSRLVFRLVVRGQVVVAQVHRQVVHRRVASVCGQKKKTTKFYAQFFRFYRSYVISRSLLLGMTGLNEKKRYG